MKISRPTRSALPLQPERLVRDHADQRDREQQQREGEEDVHQPADQRVDPAAEVAGDRRRATVPMTTDEQRGQERDQQRDPGAVDDPAEDVPAVDRLEAERVVPADAAATARSGVCRASGRSGPGGSRSAGCPRSLTISGAKIATRIRSTTKTPPAMRDLVALQPRSRRSGRATGPRPPWPRRPPAPPQAVPRSGRRSRPAEQSSHPFRAGSVDATSRRPSPLLLGLSTSRVDQRQCGGDPVLRMR